MTRAPAGGAVVFVGRAVRELGVSGLRRAGGRQRHRLQALSCSISLSLQTSFCRYQLVESGFEFGEREVQSRLLDP